MPNGRKTYSACPACGCRFPTPLQWSARCTGCGKFLSVAAKMADAGAGADGGGFSPRRLALALVLLAVAAGGYVAVVAPPAVKHATAPAPAGTATAVDPDAERRKHIVEALPLRAREVAECADADLATQTALGNVPANALALGPRAGALRFAYNPALAPDAVPESRLAGMISAAAQAWSACGIPGQYVGTTRESAGEPHTFVVQWYSSEGVPIAGYRKGSTIYLNAGHFEAMRVQSHVFSLDVMQRLISHEMGHAFGLVEHSARCVDVMATEDSFDKCDREPAAPRMVHDRERAYLVKQQAFPTACDIKRCRQVNGLADPAGS